MRSAKTAGLKSNRNEAMTIARTGSIVENVCAYESRPIEKTISVSRQRSRIQGIIMGETHALYRSECWICRPIFHTSAQVMTESLLLYDSALDTYGLPAIQEAPVTSRSDISLDLRCHEGITHSPGHPSSLLGHFLLRSGGIRHRKSRLHSTNQLSAGRKRADYLSC